MNVLSLFDGISCGQIALNRAGIKYDKYFASEIDKHTIKVTQHNYPNTIQLGSVVDVKAENLPKIDLILAGSPCQGFSTAGKGLNFEDPRSKLFFEFVRLLKECQPRYFLLENVRMKKEWRDIISDNVGVEPILINSALVSAQNRERYYWTNIPNVTKLSDKHISFNSILQSGKSFFYKANCLCVSGNKGRTNRGFSGFLDHSEDNFIEDSNAESFVVNELTSLKAKKRLIKIGRSLPLQVRKLSKIELERLQTIPDNYTKNISNNLTRKALGNC